MDTNSETAPQILGYEVEHTDVGWTATYTGLLTENAITFGCERVLVDEDLARLKIRAIKNRISAWSWEYEGPEDTSPA
ncbi:hypothetical protein ACSDR0_16975 [Streptosporangium sp. G11]|uniref:hypothetical protein n=1 Tax=Streptosporangium sp. G11 TaxID=3436926 RepID=UPI003EB9C29B